MSEDDFFTEKPNIEGVNKDIINDLHNIVDKFGSMDTNDSIMRFSSGDLGLGYEINMSASLDGRMLIITRSSSKITFQGLEFMHTIIGDVFWDRKLTSEEVKNATRKIYDLVDGKMVDKFDFKPGKYSVDETFSEVGTVFMVPNGEQPQKFINRFDKPEELIVTKNPVGVTVVQHRDDLLHIKKREEIVLQVCKERGIDIDKIDFVDVMELRQEIQRRMDSTK